MAGGVEVADSLGRLDVVSLGTGGDVGEGGADVGPAQAASARAPTVSEAPMSARTGMTLGGGSRPGPAARPGGAMGDQHAGTLALSGGKWSTVAPLGETKVTCGA